MRPSADIHVELLYSLDSRHDGGKVGTDGSTALPTRVRDETAYRRKGRSSSFFPPHIDFSREIASREAKKREAKKREAKKREAKKREAKRFYNSIMAEIQSQFFKINLSAIEKIIGWLLLFTALISTPHVISTDPPALWVHSHISPSSQPSSQGLRVHKKYLYTLSLA